MLAFVVPPAGAFSVLGVGKHVHSLSTLLSPFLFRLILLVTIFSAAFTLPGCTIKHRVLSDDDHATRAELDLSAMYAQAPEAQSQVSVEDLLAQALYHNLDHRIAMVEEALAVDQIDIAKLSLWPNGVFNGQAQDRNNQPGGRSQSIISGEESLEPSASQERRSRFGNVEFVWNVLDFGVSYVTAQQRHKERDILHEKRRKATHGLARDVFSAYLSTWVAQRYESVVDELLAELQSMVESYGRLIDKGLKRKKAMVVQRELLAVQGRLWKLKESFSGHRLKLLSLANLPPGAEVDLLDPGQDKNFGPLSLPIGDLESIALRSRPELRVEDYNAHISALEARKEILRMFPGLEFGVGASRDTNKFLFNNSWSNAGMRISWNLMDLARGSKLKKFRYAERDLAILRRQALSVAVLMQVRLAAQKYLLQQRRFVHSTKLAAINSRVWTIDKSSSRTRTKLDVLKSKTEALISIIQRENSYAKLLASRVDMLHSIGIDLIPPMEQVVNQKTAVMAIGRHWKDMMKFYFYSES